AYVIRRASESMSAARSPNRWAASVIESESTTAVLGEVEAEHADGVASHDLAHRVVRYSVHELGRHLLRVRPRRVGVRIVGLERDVVDTDLVERVDAVM